MSSHLEPITNISAYQFVALSDLSRLRETLKTQCNALGIKGTILLGTEGFNLFLAGLPAAITQIEAFIRELLSPEFDDFKRSYSSKVPFKRLLVKSKKEILSFGQPGIDPALHPAPRISPQQFKQWLDEGRDIKVLDVRNDYEVRLGTFNNAIALNELRHFRHFPEKLAQLPSSIKQATVVTFCTGGIRCEKAAPFLMQQGFENVYQLDGGILRYFEECGDAHYSGECFVFDHRVALDGKLEPTHTAQCFACRMPVTVLEQQLPSYVEGLSCPACHS